MIERMWVTPENDAESYEIVRLLEERHELILVSKQPWGATWAALEPHILGAIERFRRKNPHGDVIGVEFGGPAPFGARNIDHHKYQDDDRTHPLSSLEQIAAELRIPLSRRRLLIALNDRGYIPAMRAAGATAEEIREIRQLDRRCQGVTEDVERQARFDVAAAERRGLRALVRCTMSATSAHTDLLLAEDPGCQELLLASPIDWSYSGPRTNEFRALDLPEPYWSGGAHESGYFGVSHPSLASQERLLSLFWG